MVVGLEPLLQCNDEPRFTQPGLCREQHHLPLSALCPLPAEPQQFQFLVAPNQRRQSGRVKRLEAALNRAHPEHLPCLYRRVETLRLDSPEIAVLEEAPQKPTCARRDDDTARFCNGLEASGKVRGLADNSVLLCGS